MEKKRLFPYVFINSINSLKSEPLPKLMIKRSDIYISRKYFTLRSK